MRIIAGLARGHRLKAPGGATRPATDRTREAVFSLLGERVHGARLLDLFCGSGSYGLEGLSRGACHADFVDHSRPVIATLRRNADHPAFAEHTTIHCHSVKHALDRLHQKPATLFDLVFADPPYELSDNWQALANILPIPHLLPLMAKKALLVLERSAESEDTGLHPPVEELELLTRRCYGQSCIEIFHRA